MGNSIREPAVSGLFYPADEAVLSAEVHHYLEAFEGNETVPKALIVPHAGYIYSGSVAANAYALLKASRQRIQQVVLLGPAHRVAFRGLAVPEKAFFKTPLGLVPVDSEKLDLLGKTFHQVIQDDRPHAEEHCLEVHLPFLQKLLDAFSIIPIIVGQASVNEVAEVLDALWGGPETLIIISSDLSHYHDYETALKRDSSTSHAIETLQGEEIGPEDACGYLPVRGLLQIAMQKEMTAVTVAQKNSGDTAGTKDRVVGYGAYAFR